MKLLLIGTDRNLFDPNSAVRRRAAGYGALVEEIRIVVFTLRNAYRESERIAENVYVHPTASRSKLCYLPDAWSLARSIVRDREGEWLVSTQDPFECGLVGYALALSEGLPLHIQLHTDPFSVKWRRSSFFNALRFWVGMFLLPRADGVRVVSERVRRGVLALGVPEDRVTVVPVRSDLPTMIERTDLSFLRPGYGKYVLSVGRLEREKDFASLLRAFREVKKIHGDALLIIIGSGREHRRLVTLSERLGIAADVAFLPWSHDISAYFRGADCYVQSSLYEGWGMAVVEAMASGTPVVMTDVGCAGELVVDETSGLVVPVGDHRSLAAAISRILGDRGLSDRLRSGAFDALRGLPSPERTLSLYRKSWEKAIEARKVKS